MRMTNDYEGLQVVPIMFFNHSTAVAMGFNRCLAKIIMKARLERFYSKNAPTYESWIMEFLSTMDKTKDGISFTLDSDHVSLTRWELTRLRRGSWRLDVGPHEFFIADTKGKTTQRRHQQQYLQSPVLAYSSHSASTVLLWPLSGQQGVPS